MLALDLYSDTQLPIYFIFYKHIYRHQVKYVFYGQYTYFSLANDITLNYLSYTGVLLGFWLDKSFFFIYNNLQYFSII